MSSTYAFVPTNRATGITIPSDGDTPIKAADVNPALQAVGDLAANAIERLEPLVSVAALAALLVPVDGMVRLVRGHGIYTFLAGGGAVSLGSTSPFLVTPTDGTVGRWISSTMYARLGGSTRYHTINPAFADPVITAVTTPAAQGGEDVGSTGISRRTDGVYFSDVNTANTDARELYLNLNPYLDDKVTILGATVYLKGAGAHAGLPARMPRATVVRTVGATGAVPDNLLAATWATDGSGSTAAYQATHTLTVTPDQNAIVDLATYSYKLCLHNEAHTNAKFGLTIYSVQIWTGPS